jgi:catechol-2,3-dioxygenase
MLLWQEGFGMSSTARLGHVSLPSAQPQQLAGFYRDLLDLEVSMEGSIPELGDFVFLSRHAGDELPLIALCTELRARHSAVEVESLAALQTVCAQAVRRGIAPSFALNHRCSLSVYFHDPEGNVLEVFWATGIKTDAPFTEPLDLADLDQPEAELLKRLRVEA